MVSLKNRALQMVRNSLLQHLLFWALSWFILLHIFSGSSTFQKIDYIYTSIFLATIVIPAELNLLLLIPRFLNRKKYFLFLLLFLVCIFLFSAFNQLLFSRLIDMILPGYYFISYYSYADILKFFLVFLLITTLLHLSKEWFELNEARQKVILLEKEKIDAELKALSNQVNPHFLFNSLHVLYSLAIKKARETPEAIIKLSDILRYVIHESNQEFVALSSEISLIKNYLDLQHYRIPASADVQFRDDVNNEQLRIAPMLFLPLVENSFKHGVRGDVVNTFVNIVLTQKGKRIEFTISNNKGYSSQQNNNSDGGVGLENIRNRLLLIYPKSHTFEVEDGEKTFMVKLKIEVP